MREADEASTKELSNTVRGVVPAPPGVVMVAPPTVPRNAERGGRKAKAAFSNRGGLEQRGKQHTHYKGRDALKHNSEPGHLGSCMA
jgi:hypothetical protein